MCSGPWSPRGGFRCGSNRAGCRVGEPVAVVQPRRASDEACAGAAVVSVRKPGFWCGQAAVQVPTMTRNPNSRCNARRRKTHSRGATLRLSPALTRACSEPRRVRRRGSSIPGLPGFRTQRRPFGGSSRRHGSLAHCGTRRTSTKGVRGRPQAVAAINGEANRFSRYPERPGGPGNHQIEVKSGRPETGGPAATG